MVEPRVSSVQVHSGLHGDHGGAWKRQVGEVSLFFVDSVVRMSSMTLPFHGVDKIKTPIGHFILQQPFYVLALIS